MFGLRYYIIVFSFGNGRGNCEYRTFGRITFDEIREVKKRIAEKHDIEVDSIIIENIIELK